MIFVELLDRMVYIINVPIRLVDKISSFKITEQEMKYEKQYERHRKNPCPI